MWVRSRGWPQSGVWVPPQLEGPTLCMPGLEGCSPTQAGWWWLPQENQHLSALVITTHTHLPLYSAPSPLIYLRLHNLPGSCTTAEDPLWIR